MKPTTLRIPDYLIEKIDETADKRGIKSSILIREILMEWFRERKFKNGIVDTYYDWREILHSAEFKAAFRDAFLDIMPEVTGAQRDIVVGVFQSPEYRTGVKEMIKDVLSSNEYRAFQIESVAQILSSSQFIEHVAKVAERVDQSKELSPGKRYI
jgi:Arc/MetJ-type ribon-helix-helix transcriptional regulator